MSDINLRDIHNISVLNENQDIVFEDGIQINANGSVYNAPNRPSTFPSESGIVGNSTYYQAKNPNNSEYLTRIQSGPPMDYQDIFLQPKNTTFTKRAAELFENYGFIGGCYFITYTKPNIIGLPTSKDGRYKVFVITNTMMFVKYLNNSSVWVTYELNNSEKNEIFVPAECILFNQQLKFKTNEEVEVPVDDPVDQPVDNTTEPPVSYDNDNNDPQPEEPVNGDDIDLDVTGSDGPIPTPEDPDARGVVSLYDIRNKNLGLDLDGTADDVSLPSGECPNNDTDSTGINPQNAIFGLLLLMIGILL